MWERSRNTYCSHLSFWLSGCAYKKCGGCGPLDCDVNQGKRPTLPRRAGQIGTQRLWALPGESGFYVKTPRVLDTGSPCSDWEVTPSRRLSRGGSKAAARAPGSRYFCKQLHKVAGNNYSLSMFAVSCDKATPCLFKLLIRAAAEC